MGTVTIFGGSFLGEVRWHNARNPSYICSRHPLSSTARLMITMVIAIACDDVSLELVLV